MENNILLMLDDSDSFIDITTYYVILFLWYMLADTSGVTSVLPVFGGLKLGVWNWPPI